MASTMGLRSRKIQELEDDRAPRFFIFSKLSPLETAETVDSSSLPSRARESKYLASAEDKKFLISKTRGRHEMTVRLRDNWSSVPKGVNPLYIQVAHIKS